MRHAAAILILLTTGIAGARGQGGPAGDDTRIQEWIDQLGKPRYADRENAAQQLREIGLPALDLLRKATKSPDPEVRQRAQLLVRKLEDEQRVLALLAPKRLRLNVEDVTVAEAVAQLAAASGYPIELSGNPSVLTARKVTLDTGETTFWEAARQLCAKGGLVDVRLVAMGAYVEQLGAVRGGTKKKTVTGNPAALRWTIGDPAQRPSGSTGSIRIHVVSISATMPHGEIDLVLEVTGEPRLGPLGVLGTVTVDKAIDDRGESLVSVPVTEQYGSDDVLLRHKVAIRRAQVVGGKVTVDVAGSDSSRQVKVRLEAGPKRGTSLQELTGKLTLQTLIEDEPVIVIDKILDATGKSGRGKDGATLDIQKVSRLPNGDVRMVVVMDNTPGVMNLLQGGANIRLQRVVQAGQAVMGGDLPPLGASYPRLLDAAGKSFTLAQAAVHSLSINANKVVVTAELLYQPQAGQGPAAQLVLPGQTHFVFEVPFTLKNIRLP
jgi:hypothetical protein